MFEGEVVVDGLSGQFLLGLEAGERPQTEVKLAFSASVLTRKLEAGHETRGAVETQIGADEPLVHAEVVGIFTVAEVELPLVSFFPYVVYAVNICQSAAAIEPNLLEFTGYGHFDVEGVGRTEFVPPNPGFEVVSAGLLVLGDGDGD